MTIAPETVKVNKIFFVKLFFIPLHKPYPNFRDREIQRQILYLSISYLYRVLRAYYKSQIKRGARIRLSSNPGAHNEQLYVALF